MLWLSILFMVFTTTWFSKPTKVVSPHSKQCLRLRHQIPIYSQPTAKTSSPLRCTETVSFAWNILSLCFTLFLSKDMYVLNPIDFLINPHVIPKNIQLDPVSTIAIWAMSEYTISGWWHSCPLLINAVDYIDVQDVHDHLELWLTQKHLLPANVKAQADSQSLYFNFVDTSFPLYTLILATFPFTLLLWHSMPTWVGQQINFDLAAG